MRIAISSFALGVYLFQQRAELLPSGLLLFCVSAWIGVVGISFLFRCRLPRPARAALAAMLALGAGLLWAGWRAELRLADALPMQAEARDLELVGVVAGLPQLLERGVRFEFDVEQADESVPRRIQLSWYAPRGEGALPPRIRAGERWRLTVRLKRPHGFANPHGFDYEAWLLERKLRATGYVREQGGNERLDVFVARPMTLVHSAREALRERFAAQLPDAPQRGVLVALAIGDQHAISAAQWDVFRRTGIAHLVSISGLHVSLVAMIAGVAVGWGWRRVPALALRMPAQKAAAVAGLLAAAAYALLAGLGIPAQRALLMLGVAALALLAGREALGSRVWFLALFVVLLFDPWAVLSPGFWLSFAAVGVILLMVGGRLAAATGWRSAVRTQLAITLGTLPALLVLFQAFSVVSPLANAVAIPVVSFVVTPLTLLAAIVPWSGLLEVAHWVTDITMRGLQWLAASPFALRQQAAPPFVLVGCGLAGVLWAMLPRGTPARAIGLLTLVPLLTWAPERPVHGSLRAAVLDVGHGLAVHLQTAGHDLLYDAGPRYGPDADAGERVVVPYLGAMGVSGLEQLMISHDDIDHSGGAASLLAEIPVVTLRSTLPERHPLVRDYQAKSLPCRAGERWQWDGVDFEVLHPDGGEPAFRHDNDASCVLRVAAPGGSILLAGDVESAAERSLVRRAGDRLRSTVLVVPHHGSRSSSTADFVAAVAPEVAVFSVGMLNPFRHPHPAVWARLSEAGARNYRTDAQGAVLIEVDAEGPRVSVQREMAARYWHGR